MLKVEPLEKKKTVYKIVLHQLLLVEISTNCKTNIRSNWAPFEEQNNDADPIYA